MNKKTLLTAGKGIIIILILLAVVFALKAPAHDLNYFDDEHYIPTHQVFLISVKWIHIITTG